MSAQSLLRLRVAHEQDVVLARRRARELAGLLGFEARDQTRIATSVSELARNAVTHGQGGDIEFSVERPRQGNGDHDALVIEVRDHGPGIADVSTVFDVQPRDDRPAPMGILAARRLMDGFEIESKPGEGTRVTVSKHFSKRSPPPGPAALALLARNFAPERQPNPMDELREQNKELARTLEELHQRQLELAQVNQELEETNRGVVALYAELDERAAYLQRASEIKSRFLSNMSHEFRTPLNSILSLAQILLRGLDGDLTSEQQKQLTFIQKSAQSLSELVNDLLDLAKVEAGKVDVHPAVFHVADLFNVLRGMLRPLLASNSKVELIFDDPPASLPALYSDESKISQILRNFISNALKYTERGEVRIWAELSDGDSVAFAVSDTGIGIAPADQLRIFEEFTQVDSPIQRRVRGTGLGLPLCSKLAHLLGGTVDVQSEFGRGSTFRARIPIRYHPPSARD